jgi:hypothetical protein
MELIMDKSTLTVTHKLSIETDISGIPPVNSGVIIDSYPLSPMQQGMLFHSLYAPHSGVYIKQIVCTLREDLNLQVLANAWSETVARHSIMRTRPATAGSTRDR